ncbi:MAG TPA: hypothetical protein VIT90_09780, partial [Lysobacter sp.]
MALDFLPFRAVSHTRKSFQPSSVLLSIVTHRHKRPFLIVETGQPVASMRRHRGFPHWIRVAAGLEADEAVVVNVEDGQA